MADQQIATPKISDWTHKIGLQTVGKLALPKIHPDYLSGLSIIFSFAFLLKGELWYQVLLLGIVWFFDIIDGITAKKYNIRTTDEEKKLGWITDVASDRISEGIISIAYFMPLFPLFILNTILTLWSYRRKKHTILPIRQFLFIFLLIKLVFFR